MFTENIPIVTAAQAKNSLTAALQRLSSDHVDLAEVTRYYAGALARGYAATVAYRQSGRLPAEQVVDLYFTDFIRDQVGTVRRAYQHFGLELSDSAAAAMQQFLDAHPADKYGRHLYSLVDTGMDESELRELFAAYESHFNIPREQV